MLRLVSLCALVFLFPFQVLAGQTLYYGPVFATESARGVEAAAILVDERGTIQRLYRKVPGALPGVTYQKLNGAVAFPGFHDAHLHLMGIGMKRSGVDLAGVRSRSELRQRVVIYLQANPHATVVRGFGWDQNQFIERSFPTLDDIDGITSKPVFLMRVDGHAAVVNEAALALGGYGQGAPNTRSGGVFRDARGNPTGLLLDEAVLAMQAKLPEPTLAERKAWLKAALYGARDAGLTAVHDMGMFAGDIEALLALQNEEALPVRVYAYIAGNHLGWLLARCLTPAPRCAQIGQVKLMGIKLMLDGALGSRGALLTAGYSDEPDNHGHPAYSLALQRAAFKVARKLGWQVAIHAIGDEANRIAIAWVMADEPSAQSRNPVRIEHAQLLRPGDFPRLAGLNVIASMQPIHVADDYAWAGERLGDRRSLYAYAWGKLERSGATLAFGSDAPVSDLSPALGIFTALTRQDLNGNPHGGWYPENKVTLAEALEAYTRGAAKAVGEDGKFGTLLPGRQFSITIYDRDCRHQAPTCWLAALPVRQLRD